jgi:hypothetical protein
VLNEVAAQAAVTNVVLLAGEPDDKTAGRPDLDQILRDYQVRPDPMRNWQVTGLTAWLASLAGTRPEPVELSETEAEMLDGLGLWEKFRFSQIQQQALAAAEQRYPRGEVLHDDHGDAFRHAYWNALLVWEFGSEWAARYTTAHEAVPGSPAPREAMDLYNNEVGRALAVQLPLHRDDGELQEKIARALDDGALVVISSDGALRWSDEITRDKTAIAEDLRRVPAPSSRSIDDVAGLP